MMTDAVPPRASLPAHFYQRYGEQLSPVEAMELAITISEYARGFSSPNPPVGAVVLDADRRLAGIGITQPPGGNHAEIEALTAAGNNAHGGSLYVTLEPCNAHGRTGPCSVAVAKAGIKELYYGAADTTRAEGGAHYLQAHGVATTQLDYVADASLGLRSWLHRLQTKKPLVLAKIAASMDGFSAAQDGTSQWITGPEARSDGHVERSRVDAIIVGTGTFLADNPALTARTNDQRLYPHQPLRIIVGEREIVGETAAPDLGPEVFRISEDYRCAPALHIKTRQWKVVLSYLSEWEFNSVLLEGGPRLVGDAIAEDIVDRVVCYIAPIFLGQGLAAALTHKMKTLSGGKRFTVLECTRLGEDLKVTMGRNR